MKKITLILLLSMAAFCKAQLTVTLNNITYKINGELTCSSIDMGYKENYYLEITEDSLICDRLSFGKDSSARILKRITFAISDLEFSTKERYKPSIDTNTHTGGTGLPYFFELRIHQKIDMKDYAHQKGSDLWATKTQAPQYTKNLHMSITMTFLDKKKAEAALEKLIAIAKKKKK